MKSKSPIAQFRIVITVILLVEICFSEFRAGALSAVRTQSSITYTPTIILIKGTVDYRQEVGNALILSLQQVGDILSGAKYFAVTDLRDMGNSWMFLSVIGFSQINNDQQWSINDGNWFGLVLLVQ